MEDTLLLRDLAIVLTAATAAGWLLQRLGLSAVVGYLLAGIIIGPFSPAVKLVSNIDHVQFLAQIGLVFLMFAIGLGLSLARLRRMGLSIVIAVIISSLLLFNLCRLFGLAMDWNNFQTLFLAGTLMISSSAIIIKVLDELNITHQRSGQLALGITVLEDFVAVVMLTLFMSIIKVGGEQGSSLWNTLGSLSVFVAFLVVISVLVVPRVLQLLSRDAGPELRIMAITGMLLLAAIWAMQAGYSMALGAFVLGVVVAGTRFRDEVEKAFEGLHNIFGAIFFVAVGMMFDFRLLADVWGLVFVITLVTLVARPVACAFGLVAAGQPGRHALKAGLALTPIGEFAFVMIQVGKSANVLPETFYAVAIGVSLATAVVGPMLTRRSERICSWVEKHEPKPLREIIAFYHRILTKLHGRSNRSQLWRLGSRKALNSIFHVLFVSALILFSKPLYAFVLQQVGKDWLFTNGLPFLFWIGFGVLILGPIIVAWRNMESVAMLFADGATKNFAFRDLARPALQAVLKTLAAIMLCAWFLFLVPFGPWVFWMLLAAAVGVLLFAPVFWRRLVVLHSKLELDFREKIKTASTIGATSGLPVSVLERPQEWQLEIDEVVLPFGTEHAGRRIGDLEIRKKLGCSIMAIDRQGCLIANPDANEKLFAADKLLLLGTGEQLAATEQFLRGAGSNNPVDDFDEITMEPLELPDDASLAGKTLAELNLVARFGVQVCGIQRDKQKILVPSSEERIMVGDKLLLLSTRRKIQEFRSYVWREQLPPG